MPTIQFSHNMRACSSSVSASLQLRHTIDTDRLPQRPMELRDPSPGWLRAVQLGADLQIELACFVEDVQVPLNLIQTFPFVVDTLAKVQEVRSPFIATSA
jgi:hypothetical protein